MDDRSRFARISVHFDELVDLPLTRRAARLATLDLDATDRAELEAMLAADARSLQFEAAAVSARDALLGADEPSERRIATWTIEGVLGRGGMGEVLRVHRNEGGFEQSAALKRIPFGAAAQGAIARFLRERELLARLEHPHIARLIDGGLDAHEQPFLVMELIQGQTLLDWCAARHADLAARVDRFLEVARAVAYAHSQLVVHCDIKPANVMVDQHGHAKLLDFGVARLLGPSRAQDGTITRGVHCTPAYAAPEQLRGAVLSTATDVYALGALLYELVSGQRAYAFDPARPDTWGKMLDGPTCLPPSAAAGRAAERSVPAIAPRWLNEDFDTLVLKALQRDPERRYASVDALIADVQRWRSGMPISARRDSLRYRATRFLARHRLASILAGLAVLLVLGALALAIRQAGEARLEAARAAAAQRFLGSMFATTDPLQSADLPARNAREMLDAGAARLPVEFADQPALQADLSLQLGILYRQFGDFQASRRLLESALSLRESLNQPPLARAVVLSHLSYAAIELSDFEASRQWRTLARTLYAEAGVDADPQLAATYGDEAWDEANAGHPEAAEAASLRAIEIARRVPNNAAQLRELLGDLGSIYFDRGDLDKASAINTEQYALARALLGDRHPETLRVLRHLGVEAIARRDFHLAEQQLTEAHAGLVASLPAGHNYVLDVSGDLAALYINTGRYAEAVPLIEAVRAARCARSGESSMECASYRLREGWLCWVRGGCSDGIARMQAAIEIARAAGGGAHAFFRVGELRLAAALLDRGEVQTAIALATAARDGLATTMREDAPERAFADEVLGLAVIASGKPADGLSLLRAAAAQRQRSPGSSALERVRGLLWLAEAEHAAGDTLASRDSLTRALALPLDDFPADHDVRDQRDVLRGWLQPEADRGCAVAELATRQIARRFGADDLRSADARIALAYCRRAQRSAAAQVPDALVAAVVAGHGAAHPRARLALALRPR
ncbi:MAG: serine/threonine-protein kinase [Lysobacterales bacterium]